MRTAYRILLAGVLASVLAVVLSGTAAASGGTGPGRVYDVESTQGCTDRNGTTYCWLQLSAEDTLYAAAGQSNVDGVVLSAAVQASFDAAIVDARQRGRCPIVFYTPDGKLRGSASTTPCSYSGTG